jgi:hypothetical protein
MCQNLNFPMFLRGFVAKTEVLSQPAPPAGRRIGFVVLVSLNSEEVPSCR